MRLDAITCLDLAADRFCVGRADGLVVVADLPDAAPLAVLRHPAPVVDVEFINATRLRVGFGPRQFLWDTAQGVPDDVVDAPPPRRRESDGTRAPVPATCARRLDDGVWLTGHDDGTVRLARDAGGPTAVVDYGEYAVPSMRDGLGGRNPGMWRFLRPLPEDRAAFAARNEALASALVQGLRAEGVTTTTARSKRDPVEAARAGLRSGDPETRAAAARTLGDVGDRRAFAALLATALHDPDGYSVEGAFVDRLETVAGHALTGIERLSSRVALDDDDLAALRAQLGRTGVARVEDVLLACGARVRGLMETARTDERAAVRVRARNILDRLDRRPPHGALAADEEDERLAAAAQDEYRQQLVVAAIDRLAVEPSPRVRRGILDLWMRYDRRMGGTVAARIEAAFRGDDDLVVRERFGRYVAARRRPLR